MLGLADQVGRDAMGVRSFVSHDHGLGWARHDVNPDLAEELSLRFGDEGVAWPDENVCGLLREQPKGQRRDRLHTAQAQNHISASDVSSNEDCGVDTASARSRW